MEKSKKVSLIKRFVTALIMIPITFWVLFKGAPYINIMSVLCGTALAWEWANMIPNKKQSVFSAIYAAALAVSVTCFYADIIILTVTIGTLAAWFASRGEKNRILLTLGVPYIAVGLGSTIWFYNIMGPYLMLWLILAVWGMDIGGYFVGSTVKGPKLAPKISPNKTWSGFLGGILLAIVFACVFVWYFNSKDGYLIFALHTAFVAVLAQIGDLIESAIKRRVGVKDSSSLIPGHGGVFDRIDGVIFATPMLLLVMFIISSFGFIE